MVGKKTQLINGREFSILKLLWEQGPLTVREIREQMTADAEIPYTTVLSLVQLMEQKGYLKHRKEGKTHRYSATVRQGAMTKRLLNDFISRFFDASPESLVMSLLDSSIVDEDTLDQLQSEIGDRRTSEPTEAEDHD